MKKEIYFSVDIETTGSCPLKHSMISLGAMAFVPDLCSSSGIHQLATFSINLCEFISPGEFEPCRDPETMEWWKQYPEEWKLATANPRPIKEALVEFEDWVTSVKGESAPIFLASPAGYDFTYVVSYLHYFLGRSIFGHRALDLRSFTMGVIGKTYMESGKSGLPGRLKNDKTLFFHTHVALDDAIEQAHLFGKLIQEIDRRDRLQKALSNLSSHIPQHPQVSTFIGGQQPYESAA